MKTKCRAPTEKELLPIYNQFQLGKGDLDLFLRVFDWCRFDPRLGELLISYLKENWNRWNPLEVASRLKDHHSPEVFGVLGSHVLLLLKRPVQKQFKSWLHCCLSEVHLKKEWSLFFIGLFSFGGGAQRAEALESLPLYSNWGFFGKTPMIQRPFMTKAPQRTLIPKANRYEKLVELFKMKKRIQTSDYLKFLEFKISQRTAELDLKRWTQKTGNTKAATFIFKFKR